MTGAATVFAKRLDPMAEFYATCFGLEVVAAAPDHYRILESGAWMLTIVQVPPALAAAIALSDPPTPRTVTPIKLSFDIPSIALARTTVAALGGEVDDTEWDFRGFRHCDCIDPEGNVVELRESVAPGY